MIKTLIYSTLLMSFSLLVHAGSVEAKRNEVRDMRYDVLERLYRKQPRVREEIANSAGYAVFSNVGVNALFFSASGGNGIAHNNRNGRDTFMNMASAGVGLGIGIKDFRAVFVFHTPRSYRNFVTYGWDFSGQADAAAKSTDKGDETSVAVTAIPGISVYQLTEAGIALQATLQGSKYWRSASLN